MSNYLLRIICFIISGFFNLVSGNLTCLSASLGELNHSDQKETQKRIQNPVEHLRWSFSRKQLMALSRQLFSQKAPSQIFNWVLNMLLILIHEFMVTLLISLLFATLPLRESVRSPIFSVLYFPAFGLNTERYSVYLRIQSECKKIKTRKTPNTDTFHAVFFIVPCYSWINKLFDQRYCNLKIEQKD